MKNFKIKSTAHLEYHNNVINEVLDFFYRTSGVSGCFLSGSTATEEMDEDSDLDIGIVFENALSRDTCWQSRNDWKICPWFHRFDADHIKPYFIIYFFEPNVKTDINLYIEDDLPKYGDGRLGVAWDKDGILRKWSESLILVNKSKDSKEIYIHEDERFWAWTFYLYSHLHRGEYYNCASEFPMIRSIVEKWTARLEEGSNFSPRRLELKPYSNQLIDNNLFPHPQLKSLKNSMLYLIEVYKKLRKEVERKYRIKWRTTDQAVDKIIKFVESL